MQTGPSSLWKKQVSLETLNAMGDKTIYRSLGLEFKTIGPDFLEATLPVDERTHRPFGFLHGGASVVLAETLGSVASALVTGLSEEKAHCFGIEINASHLNSVRSGTIWGRVLPIRLGRSLHVWDIRIRLSEDQNSTLICHSKLTVFVRENKALQSKS